MSAQLFAQHLQGLQAGTPEFVEAQEAVGSPETLVAYAEAKGFQIDADEAAGIIKAGDEVVQRAAEGLSEAELNAVVGGSVESALGYGGLMGGYGAVMGAMVGGPIGAAVGGGVGATVGGIIGIFGGDTPKSGRGRVRPV
jgi:hypothetical protein